MVRMLCAVVAMLLSLSAWSCPVNLNTASAEELATLTGVGPAKAEAIIERREKEKFATPEDLLAVKGIGEATLEKNKDCIVVK